MHHLRPLGKDILVHLFIPIDLQQTAKYWEQEFHLFQWEKLSFKTSNIVVVNWQVEELRPEHSSNRSFHNSVHYNPGARTAHRSPGSLHSTVTQSPLTKDRKQDSTRRLTHWLAILISILRQNTGLAERSQWSQWSLSAFGTGRNKWRHWCQIITVI